METFKFALFSVVVLTLLGLGGYWAVATIQSGSEYVKTEKLKKLENENVALKKEAAIFKNEISLLQQKVENNKQEAVNIDEQPKAEIVPPTPGKNAFKYQTLINELQKLIDGNVIMKLKSRGTRVGTIQEFFNIYNKTSNMIDNDFGETTKKDVIAFQKDQGLSGDGEAGKTTFSKMISWLKKQG